MSWRFWIRGRILYSSLWPARPQDPRSRANLCFCSCSFTEVFTCFIKSRESGKRLGTYFKTYLELTPNSRLSGRTWGQFCSGLRVVYRRNTEPFLVYFSNRGLELVFDAHRWLVVIGVNSVTRGTTETGSLCSSNREKIRLPLLSKDATHRRPVILRRVKAYLSLIVLPVLG